MYNNIGPLLAGQDDLDRALTKYHKALKIQEHERTPGWHHLHDSREGTRRQSRWILKVIPRKGRETIHGEEMSQRFLLS
jgi:hypothetical protein